MPKSTKSSTKRDVFVDTSGFYSLLVKRDAGHRKAARFLKKLAADKRGAVTTDYILDETATLLRARGAGHLASDLFETVFASAVCRVEWMDPVRFEQTREFFLKHADQDWSFTDCFSFRVMQELRLEEALTTDAHFQHAGFKGILV